MGNKSKESPEQKANNDYNEMVRKKLEEETRRVEQGLRKAFAPDRVERPRKGQVFAH